jgi:hypothetical protein
MTEQEHGRVAKLRAVQHSSAQKAVTHESPAPQHDNTASVQGALNGASLPTPGEMLHLQHTAGNRAVGQLIARQHATIQTKLTVGAADDPYEREADRVASQVLSMSSGAADGVSRKEDEAAAQRKPAISPLVQRHGANLMGSFDAGQNVERQIAANSNGGSPLPAKLRSELEPKFGADFSSVRVHTGSQSDRLNRSIGADAFTHSNHIYLAGGRYNPGTGAGKHLLAHELTHVVQQGAATLQRHPLPETEEPLQRRMVQRHLATGIIQRHSSWEHKSLGDMKPDDLAKMGVWEDLIDKTTKKGKMFNKKREMDIAEVEIPGGIKVKKKDVLHLLAQEMNRLNAWQRSPPKSITPGKEQTQVLKADPEWQVNMVKIGDMAVTYGELNTLADYYGSSELMKSADPARLREIVQSVRMETFENFKRIYEKLYASMTSAESNDKEVRRTNRMFMANVPEYHDEDDPSPVPGIFSGSMAAQPSGMAGQLELIGKVQGIGTQGAANQYSPTLARNACHFAPEAWHTWAHYHTLALDKAGAAYQAKHPQLPAQPDIPKSLEDANEAMLLNGFGDHYLQDSFASGHMINKTKIMQWYVQYIDEGDKWDFHKDKNWRKAQNVAYGQPGIADDKQYDKSQIKTYSRPVGNDPMNPQSVVNAHPDDWHAQFEALGLKAPASVAPGTNPRTVLEWWQVNLKREVKGKDLMARAAHDLPALTDQQFRNAVLDLVKDGIVRKDGMSNPERGAVMSGADGMNSLYVNFAKSTFILREAYKGKMGKPAHASAKLGGANEGAYQHAAKAATFSDYDMFMRSAFIQKSTNALHDAFCLNGLKVSNKADGELFQVYGDDRMFNKGSAPGVKYSADTAMMSRESIKKKISDNHTDVSTEEILDRLPAFVKAPSVDAEGHADYSGGAVMDFAEWHNPGKVDGLRNFCFNKVFPSMSKGISKITQKLAPGGMSDLGKISNAEPHEGDAF